METEDPSTALTQLLPSLRVHVQVAETLSCTKAMVFLFCAPRYSSAGPCSKHHPSGHKRTRTSPDTASGWSSQTASCDTECGEEGNSSSAGHCTQERGHRQEMLAGLLTSVCAAGPCIVWLEGVGFSQTEGMSSSIADSKRHSLQPAPQLPFIPAGRNKQLNILASSPKQGFPHPPLLSKTANEEPCVGLITLKVVS